MRILLTTLNSKYVHSNLALKYLYAVCCEEYSNVDVREFTINNDKNHVYMELVKANYDLVCFSTYIWNVEEIRKIASDLKLAKPGMKIMLGGPEVSFDGPEFAKENPWVDFIICGEGEYSFFRFMEVLNTPGKPFETVPGLIYRFNGIIYVNPLPEPMDFSIVPFPYNYLECETDRVVYYESSRGCPYRCSYCMSSIDKTVRARKIEQVKMELSYFLRKKVTQVKLVDRTFNYDILRACEIIDFLIKNDNGVTSFHLEICADSLNDSFMSLIAKARNGQFELEMGIQSTNPDTLSAINRSDKVETVLKNVKKIVDMKNVHTHVDLIAGLPYETYKVFKMSFNDVYALGADALQLGFLKILKGTPISKQLAVHGIKYRPYAPYEVISTAYISAEQLVKLHQVENMLDTYYNRGGFSDTLDCMVRYFGDAFSFYEALANYYYNSGYQNKQHSKDDNYRILYGFIESQKNEELWTKAVILLDGDAKNHMDELNYKRFSKKSWKIGE